MLSSLVCFGFVSIAFKRVFAGMHAFYAAIFCFFLMTYVFCFDGLHLCVPVELE